ncbi:MAG: hypothetical protein A3C93_02055 [Candidatus Lloydbacteria bacterium RIFCSPHIGHO2_02_FULL_54_17]|uniref:Uncharacterized protein n=1 Tax=Candidatus Lloydbacteria bacterium RIFCSPHIGHO2_02_FULL_54_17 TaxID=1798664 RepID=A0A1G2DHW5_9BACT|nr:MAG: hypothetical protein A2762_05605 [Candidatus Lloydbacteria bacterium RIFCSPHIGHO2_01_FULL_54_11]OGZ13235.1 MAG: hypothetical protein A3C93_02055 [Candidatus Lloydbacteria bacterium RIFCSPHIGHO2_02_FULL_54_17]OGZ14894.1 MAG: hypothetical protein A3H76_02665 [Candidatus Lloydbacteria bacterium RIFCSPLOWO2_02_FULL_54_12]OGZ15365.1 MAG: hypothetical protein A2948_00070 [Candidatus Lloydbacteria bacterium RIFCSPLOWO2_01_FULL_54_18]
MSNGIGGPFPFEGHEEFGGCASGRGVSHGTELFGNPKFSLDITDDDGIIAANLFGSDFGSDRVGHDPNDDDRNSWIDANDPEEDLWRDAWEFHLGQSDDDEEVADEDDIVDELGTEIRSWAPERQTLGVRRFKDTEMAPPKMATIKGHRQKRPTTVMVRGNNHPRRCRVFLSYKAGTLLIPAVRSGTLHLHHA